MLELQKVLPLARVVYCSATGASDLSNMAYMERLALWGPLSAFPDFESFCNGVTNRGVGGLESASITCHHMPLAACNLMHAHAMHHMPYAHANALATSAHMHTPHPHPHPPHPTPVSCQCSRWR